MAAIGDDGCSPPLLLAQLLGSRVSVAHVDATPTSVNTSAAVEPGYHSLAEPDAAIVAVRGREVAARLVVWGR